MDFKELIKDKTCVVVAPSGFMSGRGHGKWIDSFDFVVKMNMMYLDTSKAGDLGERLDLWYGCPVGENLIEFDSFAERNVQMMCFLPVLESAWQTEHNNFVEKNKRYCFPYRVVERDIYAPLELKLGSVPMSGVFAVYDLLLNDAKQVYAVGFDFHRSGYGHNQAVDPEPIESGWHKIKPQMEYMWELLQNEPRFDCDDNLKRILHEEFDPHYKNEYWLRRVLAKELNHFCEKLFNKKTLVFRSCTLKNFEIMADIISKKWSPKDLTFIVQSSLKGYSIFGESQVIDYGHDGAVTYEDLKSFISSNVRVYENCLIPYNGLELESYREILKITRDLDIKNVFLVSQGGTMKRLENLYILCDELDFYNKNIEKLLILNDKFGRKGII